ncbi:DUF3592 domain-containing protein [Mucilaginibacter sp. CAU 1740]|uniref:DUF3592 domain-containing protein n=1 Tax=Mucilaginibacter sp. CAU 1740 TaxID=3140365 RepID=UPI00325B53AF
MVTSILFSTYTKTRFDAPTAALITGAIGTLFCILGAVLRDRRKKLLESGVKVEGEVFDIEYDPRRNDSTGIYFPVIQYITTDGKEITQKYNFGNSRKTYKKGDNVAVIYDPANPSTFILNKKTSRLGPWISIALGLFFVITAIIAYVLQ